MKRFFGKSSLLLACTLALTVTGCRGVRIDLKQASYAPAFDTADLAGYKGKTVFVSDIANNARGTTIWDYYSGTSRTYYEAWPTLRTYFWDCFVKAFDRVGVTIAPDAQNAPDFSVSFTSISDQELVFDVVLARAGEAPFKKQYKVETPPPDAAADPAALENRGYRQIDQAFTAVVADPDFRKAFLKK